MIYAASKPEDLRILAMEVTAAASTVRHLGPIMQASNTRLGVMIVQLSPVWPLTADDILRSNLTVGLFDLGCASQLRFSPRALPEAGIWLFFDEADDL